MLGVAGGLIHINNRIKGIKKKTMNIIEKENNLNLSQQQEYNNV